MYEQIINSAIDFSILVMEGFLAFYLLAEMLPIPTIEPTAVNTAKLSDNITAAVEVEDMIEIIVPTLMETQAPKIIEVAPKSLNLPVRELVVFSLAVPKVIAKQHKIKGCSQMRKGKLQEVLIELGIGFGVEVPV
jgi:hypothetical protein